MSNLWTTFCPSKICWEVMTAQSKGKSGTSNWLQNKKLIQESLRKLKTAGINGLRLVIYPMELTHDGKTFDWTPIETMLDFCTKEKLAVDLCIGPFQYPNYPGVYLPEGLAKQIADTQTYLDDNPGIKQYGEYFLEQQLDRYGNDKRIHGFHFANEWPDRQGIKGKEKIKVSVSKQCMQQFAEIIVQKTKKPISINTNIDAADKRKLNTVFSQLLSILNKQAKLGFDIYPTQETWKKAPLQKLRRWFEAYHKSFFWSRKRFAPCEMYFAEVEAQPWGNGKSWYRLITNEPDPNQQIYYYKPGDLQKIWENFIKKTNCKRISLWGADFWLSADAMGITWPLKSVTKFLHAS